MERRPILVIKMINLKEINKETISKYNLEVINFDIDENELFIMIKNSSWWVLGIDEKENILYVQNDGDGIFHNISFIISLTLFPPLIST